MQDTHKLFNDEALALVVMNTESFEKWQPAFNALKTEQQALVAVFIVLSQSDEHGEVRAGSIESIFVQAFDQASVMLLVHDPRTQKIAASAKEQGLCYGSDEGWTFTLPPDVCQQLLDAHRPLISGCREDEVVPASRYVRASLLLDRIFEDDSTVMDLLVGKLNGGSDID